MLIYVCWQALLVWILVFIVRTVGGKSKSTRHYGLDAAAVCRQDVTVYQMKEQDSVLVLAKGTIEEHRVDTEECSLILGPLSAEQSVHIDMNNFDIKDCDVELKFFQSPGPMFDIDAMLLKTFSCFDKTPESFTASQGSFVKITLLREVISNKRQYNFRLNVTLRDSKPVTGLSSQVKVAIILPSVIVCALMLIIICKVVTQRYLQRRDEHSDFNEAILRATMSSTRFQSRTNSYTSLPGNEVIRSTVENSQGSIAMDAPRAILSYQRVPKRETNSHLQLPYDNIQLVHRPDNVVSHIIEQTIIQDGGDTVQLPSHTHVTNSFNNHSFESSNTTDTHILPPSSPKYEEALDMPMPSSQNQHKEDVSPIYQNL